MTPSQNTSTGVRSRVSLAANLAAVAISLLGVAAFAASISPQTASADATGPVPALDIDYGCAAGELHYVVKMTNAGLGSSHFDISVNRGSGATLYGYDVVSGNTVTQTFIVTQGTYAFFDISNVDDATIVVDHQKVTADCKAEPYTEIGVICPADHSTPFVYLEWVNLSYAHASYFEVFLNGVKEAEGSLYGANNTHFLSFDLVDGQHVAAAILADGVVIEEVNTDVDCPPASTTTQHDTTQPDATQSDTTAPGSTLAEPPLPTTTVADMATADTTTADTATSDTATSDTATQPDSATTLPGAVAEQLPIAGDHSDASLPATGSGSDALIVIALKVVLGGLGMVLLARRFR